MSLKASKTFPDASRLMARALTLARRAIGRTDPNPMVGAIVLSDGEIVGQGYHRAAGRPHAEIEAIRDAGEKTAGADLFVTLEPCNHHGRTPPCSHAILEAGIKRVFYGMDDPNPNVAGGGRRFLEQSGVEVIGPILEKECRRLNEVFLVNVVEKRPFVFLKLAMSLDGRIATRTGKSKWITCDASRRKVHRLRDRVSAIAVGIGTILADDPSLTTRLPRGRGKDPIRVVMDSNLRTPPSANIFNPSSDAGVILACSHRPPEDRAMRLEEKGARILRTGGREKVDLKEVVNELYGSGVTSILVEGGAGLAWGALDARIVDRCVFFYAPKIIGGVSAAGGVGGLGVDEPSEGPRLTDLETSRVDEDICISGRVAYP